MIHLYRKWSAKRRQTREPVETPQQAAQARLRATIEQARDALDGLLSKLTLAVVSK